MFTYTVLYLYLGNVNETFITASIIYKLSVILWHSVNVIKIVEVIFQKCKEHLKYRIGFPFTFLFSFIYNCYFTRLLSMRMPRTSSFSVRDILDLGPKQNQDQQIQDTKLPADSRGESNLFSNIEKFITILCCRYWYKTNSWCAFQCTSQAGVAFELACWKFIIAKLLNTKSSACSGATTSYVTLDNFVTIFITA